MATGPIETHLHRSFNWENGASGAREGPRGRSANCGNGLFAQCVRLRSEINLADRVSWSSLHIRATHPSEAHSNSILNAKTYVAETFRENSP